MQPLRRVEKGHTSEGPLTRSDAAGLLAGRYHLGLQPASVVALAAGTPRRDVNWML